MISLISFLLIALAVLLAIVVATLVLEIAAALLLGPRRMHSQVKTDKRPRIVVLVPAHNESAGLLPTVDDITAQLSSGDRLLVVADNCEDDTAEIAAAAGAEVIERDDPINIGKGYALDFGLKHLSLDPPQVVIIVDADCRIGEGSINRLAMTCVATGRPTQALDLMTASPRSPINFRVAEFAWRVKNWIRPLGLAVFNLPCQLMGTGMAIPWSLTHSVRFASASLVEDLVLGLDLTLAGSPPQFCPSARVTSQFPLTAEGAKTQRYRWEQGHLQLIATAVPRYFLRALAGGNLPLFALALDLAVPPLSLLMMLQTALFMVTGLAVVLGLSPVAFLITAAAFVATVSSILIAWWKYGRDVLPIQSIALVATYVASKIPMYFHTLTGNIAARWTRTDRKTPP